MRTVSVIDQELKRLSAAIKSALERVYEAGGKEGVAQFVAKATALATGTPAPMPQRKARGRRAQAPKLVVSVLEQSPGLRGVDIVKKIQEQGTAVHERTIRTALRRLKKAGVIAQREGKWYREEVKYAS